MSPSDKKPSRRRKPATEVVHSGRDPHACHGFVNPPVYRGSTVLFPTVEKLLKRDQAYTYGRSGTPTVRALEEAIAHGRRRGGNRAYGIGLPGGEHGDLRLRRGWRSHPRRRQRLRSRRATSATGSWQSSASRRPTTIPSSAPASRSSCGPTRGSSSPRAPARRPSRCRTSRPSPRSPKKHGPWLLLDNTWATPLYFRPFDHGVDVVDPRGDQVHRRPRRRDARRHHLERARAPSTSLAPRSCWASAPARRRPISALRGLRTLRRAPAQHQRAAFEIARWLEGAARGRTRPASGPAEPPAATRSGSAISWARAGSSR